MINLNCKWAIRSKGVTQKWLAGQMNKFDPSIKMTPAKMSNTLAGKRRMTAEEALATCVILEISPDELLRGGEAEGADG